jgi:hypothetical protein
MDFQPLSDEELDRRIVVEASPPLREAAIVERQRRQSIRALEQSAQGHRELLAQQERLRTAVDSLTAGQAEVKRSVDRLAKPHHLLWWTFAVAFLTFVVCVIGYWDQIVRLLRALRLWH